MKRYTKTFIGSVIAFLVGTSCCWLSTVTIWFGGVAFITVLVNWIESIQVLFILLSVILVSASVYFYFGRKD